MRRNADFETLGLTSDASWDEVKAAFRRMARLYHPDVAGPDGAQKFTEITEAYMTLKESISPGVSHRAPPEAAPEEDKIGSLLGRARDFLGVLWARLVSLIPKRHEEDYEEQSYEYEIPPARVRFIGSILSRAEADIFTLLSRRSAVKERNTNEAILRRLRSRHPGVVILALRRVSSGELSDEIRRLVLDHFRRNMPTAEVLECLLSIFSSQSGAEDFAQALMPHAANFSNGDVTMLLSWLKRRKMRVEYFSQLLSHPSDSAVAAVLSNWPQNESLPDTAEVFSLLKKNDEAILVPLLRLLKKGRVPVWMLSTVVKLSREHKSPAVRVWASAIVRDQNTS